MLCTAWFRDVFVPKVTVSSEGRPVLLIYDGHGSHVVAEIRKLAIDNNIHLYKLPPHTTHKLQPLDVGIFGPIQRYWQEQCDQGMEDTGRGLHVSQVPRVYFLARACGMRTEIIVKAWVKSGLNPINVYAFTEQDYSTVDNRL